MIKLESCDILLYRNEGTGWKDVISRYLIGPYEHVSTFIGVATEFNNTPFIFQSEGRGAVIDSLKEHTGRLVTLMRPDHNLISDNQIVNVMNKAIEIASDPDAYYDYIGIVKYVALYVLKKKFPWLPINPPPYKRGRYMICSEAAAEIWWRIGVDIVPENVPPLPGDFAISPILTCIGAGRIMEDIVP